MALDAEPIPPAVAIILVNWNGWRDSTECIDSILLCGYPDFHIFLVDNDSSDQSVEHIIEWCERPHHNPERREFTGVGHYSDSGLPIRYRLLETPFDEVPDASADCRLTLIRSGGNLGFAGGNNVGIRVAGLAHYDYFWLLNTDTVIRIDTLDRLVERAQQDASIGIVGSTLLYYSEPSLIQAKGGGLLDPVTTSVRHIGEHSSVNDLELDPSRVEQQMAYVVGASMLVTTPFVREIGIMQEDYFLYFEEIDWAMRARGKFKLGYAPLSHVYHKVGASSAKVATLFSLNLLYRNRIRFVGRFLPERLAATKWHLAVEMGRHLLKGRVTSARLIAKTLWDARQLAGEPARKQEP